MISYTPISYFNIGPLKVYAWGIMVALAFAAILYFSLKEARKTKGVEENHVVSLIFYSLLGSLIGGRLLYIIVNLSYYLKSPVEIVKIWNGGMMIYGGILFAILFCFIYIKKHKLNFWKYADLLAPYLALGLFIGRIGCFLNGCCFGEPTSLPWGMIFPQAPDDLPRHPTQLYMSLFGLFTFITLKAVKNRFEGFRALLFAMMYSVFSLFIEFIRYYPEQFMIGIFSVSQWISIIISAIAALLICKKRK